MPAKKPLRCKCNLKCELKLRALALWKGEQRERTGGNEGENFNGSESRDKERNKSTALNITAAEELIQESSLLMKGTSCHRGRERRGIQGQSGKV